MGPIVDENLKSDLIMSKQIRQATSKILQRPSQFNGYKSKQIRLYILRYFFLAWLTLKKICT